MDGRDPLETMRDQVRRHHLRLAIVGFAAQGKSTDPQDLCRALPTHPAPAVIEYHLLVLRGAGLLPSPAGSRQGPGPDVRGAF
jgi:hypothetical protein